MSRSLPPSRVLAAVLVVAFASTACDELSARRSIQKGDKLYGQAKFSDAIGKYEEALGKSPDLDVGHHNAALAYYRLFTPGDPSPENANYAAKAAEHFLAYLEKNSTDTKVITLLTQIWIDSEKFDTAIAYWESVRAKNPDDPIVLARLADINRLAGRFDKALEWLEKRVEVEKDEAGKVRGYVDIAQVQWSRLTNPDLVDAERLVVADSGLAALQKAWKINQDNQLIQSLMGSIYQFRSLAHGASWARVVEAAAQRYHQIRAIQISRRTADAAKAAGAGGGTGDKKPDAPGPKKAN